MSDLGIVFIILATVAMTLITTRGRLRHSRTALDQPPRDPALEGQVDELKERIRVLERITVDKENSLSREIESLRDR